MADGHILRPWRAKMVVWVLMRGSSRVASAWARLRVDGFGPNGAAACDSGPDAVGATSGWAVRARMTSRKC